MLTVTATPASGKATATQEAKAATLAATAAATAALNSRHNNSGSGYVLCLEFQKQPETQDEMTAIETHT